MRRSSLVSRARLLLARCAIGVALVLMATVAAGGGLVGCVPAQTPEPASHLERARAEAEGSQDPERVGAWLLLELVAPGGEVAKAAEARKRLADLGAGTGLQASLAQALDADVHGRFLEAGPAYLRALRALLGSSRADADLLGWFVADRLVALRHTRADLWEQARELVQQAMDNPASLGWRGRGELVEWWSAEALHEADAVGAEKVLEQVAERHGCVGEATMAGPFGRGTLAEHRVRFEAERPGPWPLQFSRDARGGQYPKTLPTSSHACAIRPKVSVRPGVFYAQTFLELDDPKDLILAIQGAYAVFVDDVMVMERDMGRWGVWPRFGVRLRLGPGRHRVVARLVQPETSIRVLDPSGRPAQIRVSADQGAPYELAPPQLLADPNALDPFLRALGVPAREEQPPRSRRPPLDHPVLRYVASYLAHVDGQDDIASVIFEPLVKKSADATPVSVAQQAVFVDNDPIYPRTVARDLARDLREQAAEGDEGLWGARLWLALERGDKAEPADLARELEKLVSDFPQVPTVVGQLARVYDRLGWQPERLRTLEKAAEQFSEDTDVLLALLEAYEQSGQPEAADRLAARIRAIDPTQEVTLRRALARRDYDAAIAELRRLAKIRRDREVIAVRIEDLLVRAGRSKESLEALEMALANDPDDSQARLAVADARFAGGDDDALTDALVDAIQTGAEDGPLRTAIQLVEGVTDLEPFRRDGLKVVQEAEASGVELPGTAVRILDYGALWVGRDGTARMLEHEIIRVQSREGIARHVEQSPRGMILHLRTIKKDGTILEPEIVAGKPTVTMPKLEVGDYIETEHILTLRGASGDGRRYRSPRWFFREENTSYLESEFVIISPSGRTLDVETTGDVPAPTVDQRPGLTVHRWRVEGSVALPEEPLSAPINEFLPSVRAGWGIDLDEQLRRVVELSLDDTPRDPRMVRIARTIVAGKLDKDGAKQRLSIDDKAKRIYRWVLDTIQPGDETVGPRIITGKAGDPMRAFTYLARLAGLDARLGLVRDRLAPPPLGPFSKAEMFQVPAVRLALDDGSRWFMVGERFAPYGYLPSSLRGQPAVVIQPEGRITSVEPPLPARETTSDAGGDTGIGHVGITTLRADGSADIELTQTYRGRYAIQLRTVFNKVPVSRRKDVVEAQLLGLSIPGGRLDELDVPNLDALDEPVTLAMNVDAPNFARVAEGELVLEVPFLGSIAKLVRLPQRETPLYISERLATRAEVELRITLPEGASPIDLAEPVTIDEPRLKIVANDAMEKGKLIIRRSVAVPAGRVQPEDYAAFKAKVLEGDDVLNRKVRIKI